VLFRQTHTIFSLGRIVPLRKFAEAGYAQCFGDQFNQPAPIIAARLYKRRLTMLPETRANHL
jgi:hypothetical protein